MPSTLTATVTWRCAKGGAAIDDAAWRQTRVDPGQVRRTAQTDDADPVANLAEYLVRGIVLDVVYGGTDPDGYDATRDVFLVEIEAAPIDGWTGFARVSTAWTSVPPHVRRGTSPADVPEHRRARPAALGVLGDRVPPPLHRDPVAHAGYLEALARLEAWGREAA